MNDPNASNSLSLKYIFFNDEGKLRSGWRFLIFQLLFIFCGSFFGGAILFLLGRLSVNFEQGSILSFIVPNAILLTLSLLLGWLCGRFLERLSFAALGLWFTKNWWRDLLLGLATGAASITFAVVLAVFFGGMRLETNKAAGSSAILRTLGVSFVVFLIGAAAEEAYFRGYILQTFARARLAWVAIFFTSLFFASAHLNNQHSDWLSTTNTVLAGIWFSLAYLRTRNLWFPFGIHLMWNWLQGAVFGLPVSGITTLTTAPLLLEMGKGESLWTGGDYGIEGGIACTIAIVASTALIMVDGKWSMVRRRKVS
jgi:membrane protease YdiL (CAAX protease family)